MNNILLYAIKYEFAALLCSSVVPLDIIIVDIGNIDPCGIPKSIINNINTVKVGMNGNSNNTSPVMLIEKINGNFILLNGLAVIISLVTNETEKKYIYGEYATEPDTWNLLIAKSVKNILKAANGMLYVVIVNIDAFNPSFFNTLFLVSFFVSGNFINNDAIKPAKTIGIKNKNTYL